jgi:hypothetical protein
MRRATGEVSASSRSRKKPDFGSLSWHFEGNGGLDQWIFRPRRLSCP